VSEYCLIVAQGGTIHIGADCFLGQGCTIAARESVDIEPNVLIAEYATIRDQDHQVDGDREIPNAGFVTSPIRVGSGAWIGAHASILRGTSVGTGAVVGANSVAKGKLQDRTIYAGVPAQLIRRRGSRDEAQKQKNIEV
jgi:acetyltransferase-like isoleucine patch superfamily enzyme